MDTIITYSIILARELQKTLRFGGGFFVLWFFCPKFVRFFLFWDLYSLACYYLYSIFPKMSEYTIQEIIPIFKNKQQNKVHEQIKKIVKRYCLEQHNHKELAMLFSGVHEAIYHDMLSKKIKVEKRTLRILEFFAILPANPTLKQRKYYNKIMKE